MKIEEQIKGSTCYGVAYDENVKECKMCEVRNECKMKCNKEDVKKPERPKIEEKPEETPDEKPASKSTGKTAGKSTKSTAKKETKAETSKDTKEPAKPAKKSEKKEPSGDMPDFKAMSLEELAALADERGVDPKWRDYANDGIKRMRVTMALKKTY